MSERPLPADMAEWPASPLDLLGVGHPYGARELKKAYTRLIRFYKPELYPKEFARVRQAYDGLLPWAVEAEELPPAEEVSPPAPDGDGGGDSLPRPDAPRDPCRPRLPRPPRQDDIDRHWRQAVDGDPAPAYRGLAEGAVRRPTVERTYLRLFWLLATHRALDPERHPSHWLVRGLSACPNSPVLVNAYAMYLGMDATEAGASRCGVIVGRLTDQNQVAFLVRHAWKSLLGARRWAAVREQFSAVKEKMATATDTWLGLVRVVADHAAWEVADPVAVDLMRDCLRELEELDFVALHRPEIFDRVDYLKTLAKSAEAATREAGLGRIAALVRREWVGDLDAVRMDLHRLVADIAAAPNRWLNRFEDAGSKVNALACHCYQLVSQLRNETGYEKQLPDAPDLAERVRADLAPRAYLRYREAIYMFCLTSFVSPESLAGPLAPRYARKFPQDAPLEELILGDWPLRLACLAHRFYHS